MLPNKCQSVAHASILIACIALFISISFSFDLHKIILLVVILGLVVMLFSEEKVEDEMIKSLRMKAISKAAVIYFCFIMVLRIIMIFAPKGVRDFISDVNADAGIVILFALYYYNSFKRSIRQNRHEK